MTRSASAPSGTFSTKVVLTPAAQRRLHGLAALVVLLRPAGLGDRRDIDKAGLDGFTGSGLGLGKSGKRKTDGRERQGARRHEVFVHGGPLHGPGWLKKQKAAGAAAFERDFTRGSPPGLVARR
jgi:hypothetical protein